MGWERRSGTSRRYYCTTARCGGRRVRRYVGSEDDPHALLAWAADVEAREARRREAVAGLALRNRLGTADAMVARLDQRLDLAFEAVMLALGCHRPGRHAWRRRRTDVRG